MSQDYCHVYEVIVEIHAYNSNKKSFNVYTCLMMLETNGDVVSGESNPNCLYTEYDWGYLPNDDLIGDDYKYDEKETEIVYDVADLFRDKILTEAIKYLPKNPTEESILLAASGLASGTSAPALVYNLFEDDPVGNVIIERDGIRFLIKARLKLWIDQSTTGPDHCGYPNQADSK